MSISTYLSTRTFIWNRPSRLRTHLSPIFPVSMSSSTFIKLHSDGKPTPSQYQADVICRPTKLPQRFSCFPRQKEELVSYIGLLGNGASCIGQCRGIESRLKAVVQHCAKLTSLPRSPLSFPQRRPFVSSMAARMPLSLQSNHTNPLGLPLRYKTSTTPLWTMRL